MNDDDKTFVSMIHGMDFEELRKAAYNMEVDAVVRELTKVADHLAEHFDMYVVGAALHNVWRDYDSVITEHNTEKGHTQYDD